MAGSKRGSQRVVLLVLPFLSVAAAVAALVFLHGKYRKAEGASRASEVAQYELPRLTGAFNFRLNELREELLHLYGEQLNLARALSESERERLIFYRRDHLGGYAVLVKNAAGNWDVQKYFLRDQLSEEQRKPALEIFQEAMRQLKAPGFWLKRVDAQMLGAAFPKAIGTEGFAVAFSGSDEGGQPYGLVGIFKTSYLFSFCRYFSNSGANDALGAMPVSRFVLDDRGKVLCHSQARYDGTSFKDYSLYGALQTAAQGDGFAHYSNILDANATAAVKRVEPGGLIFAGEAVEVSPWKSAVPIRDLSLALLLVGAATIASAFGVSRISASAQATGATPTPSERGEPAVEINEFSKLKRELKELEVALLEMQSTQAFVAGFQKAACELEPGASLGRFTLEYLSAWKAPLAWIENGPPLKLAAAMNTPEPVAPFELPAPTQESPEHLAHNAEFTERLASLLGFGEFVVQPVCFGQKFLGCLVVGRASGAPLETLPQLAQIFAFVAEARR